MPRQLNIRSDEAHAIATELAQRLGVTTTEVVIEALRRLNVRIAAERAERGGLSLTPEQKAAADEILRLAREAARHKKPGATSDHSDLYDEYGLPK